MITQQTFNSASPVVQRVLRLRERLAQQEVVDDLQRGFDYRWQMWQKSDTSVYGGNATVHRCKGIPVDNRDVRG